MVLNISFLRNFIQLHFSVASILIKNKQFSLFFSQIFLILCDTSAWHASIKSIQSHSLLCKCPTFKFFFDVIIFLITAIFKYKVPIINNRANPVMVKYYERLLKSEHSPWVTLISIQGGSRTVSPLAPSPLCWQLTRKGWQPRRNYTGWSAP